MKRAVLSLFLIGVLAFAVVASGCVSKEETTPTTSEQPTETETTPAKLIWVSSQLNPPEERAFVEEVILPLFKKETGIDVEFVPMSHDQILTRLKAEVESGKVTIDLVTEGEVAMRELAEAGLLMNLDGMPALTGRTFIPKFVEYGKMNGNQKFLPFLSGTYIMIINKKAFDYLPDGLTKEDVIKGTDKWTYDAFLAWAKKLKEETGSPKVGFPAGVKGLFVRFLHGFMYPAFTGSQVKNFDSPEAVQMWEYLKELWPYVHPASTTWDAIGEPMLREEVWIGWDHIARFKDALFEKPDQFVVVPVPAGPKGRGFIAGFVGVGIPKGAPHSEAAWKLVDFLTRPDIQVKFVERGFLPAVKEASEALPEGPAKILATGVTNQLTTPDALNVLIPGLGEKGGAFKDVYRESFKRIVLENEDMNKVLKEEAERLRALFKEAGWSGELP